jgi:hypothetical protein
MVEEDETTSYIDLSFGRGDRLGSPDAGFSPDHQSTNRGPIGTPSYRENGQGKKIQKRHPYEDSGGLAKTVSVSGFEDRRDCRSRKAAQEKWPHAVR